MKVDNCAIVVTSFALSQRWGCYQKHGHARMLMNVHAEIVETETICIYSNEEDVCLTMLFLT